uniref:Uncharacterized protein LOC104224892 n=2 Tax=Nicotiana sylvestris TaxID=4096 RepID=A0A1U7W4E5_NICSY|nr:PREDICTED: uncharacterized protein LOC104224892 [Nicotiana sylvestris]
MEPKQQGRNLDKYRRSIDFPQAIRNVSNKIWEFFDDRFEITVVMDMVQQLTLKIFDSEDQREFMLTLVCAKCDSIERIELWDSLYALSNDMTLPWLVGGDFNVIWDEEDKFGGLSVHINEVYDFRHCVNTCTLFDLGIKESISTWWNGRAEEDCIFKRLDRCLGNMEFQQLWPGLEVEHLPKTGSDHCPLLIKLDAQVTPVKKPFRFINFWTQHESFQAVVRENWNADFQANSFTLFNYKLKKLKKALSRWSKATYGDIFQKLASLEEVVKVHEAQQPTREEVKQAVYGSNGQSAGGPDGFNGSFFHACWETIGDDVVEMVKAFFNGHELPKFITHTNLVLLPKKKEVITFSDMWPISLSNFINKVFSRVIHERLVGLLPNLISDEQAGFVKGRSIVENVLLTQEIITDMRLRTKAGPNVLSSLT